MQAKSLANLLRVLATQRRVETLRLLLESPTSLASSNIAAMLGVTESTASFNLMALAGVGLVLRAQSGSYAFYSPNRLLVQEVLKFFDVKEPT